MKHQEHMKMVNVDIKEFADKFNDEYDFLYKNYDRVAGYDEAVETGDIFIQNHPEFVAEFANYRRDLITSDREVAAFMFALEDMGAL